MTDWKKSKRKWSWHNRGTITEIAWLELGSPLNYLTHYWAPSAILHSVKSQEIGSGIFLRNVSVHLLNCTGSHLKTRRYQVPPKRCRGFCLNGAHRRRRQFWHSTKREPKSHALSPILENSRFPVSAGWLCYDFSLHQAALSPLLHLTTSFIASMKCVTRIRNFWNKTTNVRFRHTLYWPEETSKIPI